MIARGDAPMTCVEFARRNIEPIDRPSFAELEALPGVGHKTASVVMCQAYGIPAFPVDTHIHRLAERWGLPSVHLFARVRSTNDAARAVDRPAGCSLAGRFEATWPAR